MAGDKTTANRAIIAALIVAEPLMIQIKSRQIFTAISITDDRQ
jgi:hypothetical protein